MTAFLTTFLASSALAAEPIFVPDFTPGTSEEFAVTVMVQQLVTEQLVRDGHIVLSSAVVAPLVPPAETASCAPTPGCPEGVLPKIPSRVAVVVLVSRLGTTLVGHVEFWEASIPQPLDVRDVPIAPGNEHLFAAEVSRATFDLLARVGPSPDTVLLAAARLIGGQPVGPAPAPVVAVVPAPVPGPMPMPMPPPGLPPGPIVDLDDPLPAPKPGAPAPAPAVPMTRLKKGDGSKPHEGPIDPILEGTGVQRRHLIGAEANFMKLGLDPRDWLYKQMPHAGRLTFEIRSGLGLGDVDRDARILVETTDGQQTNAWYSEGPAAARRVRGDLFIGYAPATMVDVGVLAGLQYGGRTLLTGVRTVVSATGETTRTTSDPVDLQAVQFYVQPRVRGYLVPLGPVKPFLFTGADLRVIDKYNIDQPDNVTYPIPPGTTIPGWVGGGGMMIDPGPIVGVFAEGSYTRHFGTRAVATEFNQAGVWPYEEDDGLRIGSTLGITVAVVGGIQFRL